MKGPRDSAEDDKELKGTRLIDEDDDDKRISLPFLSPSSPREQCAVLLPDDEATSPPIETLIKKGDKRSYK